METLKLNFDSYHRNGKKTLVVEVPYQEGMVATSEFCPNELMSGPVKLMAAVRGESLDDFLNDCRRQLTAMSKLDASDNELDLHIGGLMAVVMELLSSEKSISLTEMLGYSDCFSVFWKGAGFHSSEIRAIYPSVVNTIIDLYPENILHPTGG